MKKLLIIFILILLTVGCTNQQKQNNESASLKQINTTEEDYQSDLKTEIDLKLEKCIQKAVSNTELISCGYTSINEWFSKIDNSLKQLKAVLPPDEYKLIENSQKQWMNYYNTEKKSLSKIVFHKGGTIYYTVALSINISLVKDRAELLKSYLALYENDN